MSYIEQLRATPLFAELPEASLELLCAQAEPMTLQAGETLIEEGSSGDSLFVVLRGELDVTKRSGDGELPLARIGPGAIQGEMAAIEERPRTASVRAVGEAQVLRVPRGALIDVLGSGPEAALAILRTVLGRLRSTESLLRQREKLAALGTLSAGLAHELNNPAAAMRRSAAALPQALAARDALPTPRLPVGAPPERPPLDGLARADAVEALGDDAAAAALVDAGWTPDDLAPILEGLDPDAPFATVTAGWQERETDHAELDSLLGGRTVNLGLYGRWLDVQQHDPEFAVAELEHRTLLAELRTLYLVQLESALAAIYTLARRNGDRASAIAARMARFEVSVGTPSTGAFVVASVTCTSRVLAFSTVMSSKSDTAWKTGARL